MRFGISMEIQDLLAVMLDKDGDITLSIEADSQEDALEKIFTMKAHWAELPE